jgi:hypothetical protein
MHACGQCLIDGSDGGVHGFQVVLNQRRTLILLARLALQRL